MADIDPNLRLGMSSWKFDSWKGLVYDPDKTYRPEDYLADYARHYRTVEVDQWFWSLFAAGVKLPRPETARQYAEAVPEDFIFSVKAPNALTLTHYPARQPAAHKDYANRPNPYFFDAALLREFLARLEPLRGKLGPVMFQFEYLNRGKMPSRRAYLDKLDAFLSQAPQGYEYAVECRNPNYLEGDYFELLRSRNVSLVLTEGYYMPPVGEVFGRLGGPPPGRSCILRLQAYDYGAIEKQTNGSWDRRVQPHEDRLADVAEIIRQTLAGRILTFVNVNNHFEGCAPLTAARLVEILSN